MIISEDGSVTGSIDHSKLGDVEPKTDEARAQVDALRAEQQAGAEQASADAERLAERERSQNPFAQQARDTRDEQGRETGERDQAAVDQSGTDQAGQSDQSAAEQQRQAAEQQQAEQQRAAEQQAADQPDDERDQLRAEAEQLGVQVDRRWGAERLRSEIDTARAQG